MVTGNKGYLNFEKQIVEIDKQIEEVEKLGVIGDPNTDKEIRKLRKRQGRLLKKIYSNLNAWQIVQVARHPKRPIFRDYLEKIVPGFCELHGDRRFGDDRAIITGLGTIGKEKVMIIGQNKGRTLEQKDECHFGCPMPEGYRKAFHKMKLAEKYKLPVVTFIDTPGAYPGIGAEERGIAQAIAVNLREMSKLKVPIVSVVIGEGGSGGALGIGVGDRLAMLQYSYYSVITPEGCAAILWRDAKKAPEAAKVLKLTSLNLYKLRLIDEIIPEPIGGAHRNPQETMQNVKRYISKTLTQLKKTKIEDLIEERYKRLRAIGK